MSFDRDSKIKSKYIILLLSILWFFSCNHKNPTQNQSLNTWISVSQGLTCKEVQCLAIDPLDQNILYAGTKQGIFKTTNAAKNWQNQSANMTSKDIKTIAIHPLKSNIIILGTWGGGIFKGESNGDSWVAINNGLADPRVFVVTAMYNDNPIWYAGTESGLFMKRLSSEIWEKAVVAIGGGATTCIAVFPKDSSKIYVGVKYAGVYKSSNGGASWEQKNNGLPRSPENGYISPTAIQVDPVDNNKIFMAAGWSGLFVSYDAGESWLLIRSFPAGFELKCLVINPNNPNYIFIGTNNGVLHSMNAGDSWIILKNGLINLDIRALAIDPIDPRIIYAGTMGGGVFKYVMD